MQTLCDAIQPRGGTWNRAGSIVFSADAGRQLYRVSSAGGEATALVLDQPNRESHWPDFLPDGRHFVYFARRNEPGVFVASLDSTQTKLITSGYIGVDYVEPGYLLLLAGGPGSETAGTLMAQRFDVDRLQLVGDAVPVAENARFGPFDAAGPSRPPTMDAWLHGSPLDQVTQLRWFDRQGKELGHLAAPGGYGRFDLAPDEKTVAVEIFDPLLDTSDIWLMDTTRGVTSRFTLDAGSERFPLWSRDGRNILFSSPRHNDPPAFFRKIIQWRRSQRSWCSNRDQHTGDRHFQRRYARLRHPQPQDSVGSVGHASEVRSRRRTSGRCAISRRHSWNTTLISRRTDAGWHTPRTSPGRFEIYVGAFPGVQGALAASTQGGVEPRWRRDGKELFYMALDRTLTAVAVQSRARVHGRDAERLFKTRVAAFGAGMWKPQFAVSGDGQRFLINTIVEDAATPPVTVVLNWPAALNR